MFVRWKRRKLKKKWHGGCVRYAVLVKSERVNGKPRQKVIKYLGHIADYGLEWPGHRFDFWDRVDKNLGELGLDDKSRREIERKLDDRVPRPTPEQYAEREKAIGALRERLQAMAELGGSAHVSAAAALLWALQEPEPVRVL